MSKKRALMVSLQSNEGTAKIVLEDIVCADGKTLTKDALYTFKEYDFAEFENLEFDEKELADFGYSVIARLYAFYKMNEI